MTGRKKESQNRAEKNYHILGWALFIVCAAFFIVSSLLNKDIWTFAGSIVFLAACIVFLIPLLKSDKRSEE
jgi:predicted membrane channel-forming protein YqfA (hemolysin III family)